MNGWKKVMAVSVAEIVLVAVGVSILLIRGVEPVLLSFLVLFGGAWLWSRRNERAGTITLFVLGILFTLLNAPFVIPALDIGSPVQFFFNVLFLLGGLGVVVAGFNLVRNNSGASSAAPKRWLIATGILALVLVAASVVVRVTADQAVAQPGDLKLTAENTEFSTDSLSGSAGTISVFVQNKDLSTHTFTIDALDVDISVPGSSSRRISFDASAGSYEYHCTIPGHDDMKGTLDVVR